MHRQRGRQALRDFLGERRPGDDRERHVRRPAPRRRLHAGSDRAGLESLGRPGHASVRGRERRQRMQGFGEGMRRHDDQHQIGVAHGGGEVGGRLQRVRQGDAGQVVRVFVARLDRRDDIGIATPQHGAMPVARDQRRQRGAPGARAEDGDRRRRGAAMPGVSAAPSGQALPTVSVPARPPPACCGALAHALGVQGFEIDRLQQERREAAGWIRSLTVWRA